MNPLALIPPIRQIVDVLQPVLVFFHDLGLGWGMTIVALTICVRAALTPLKNKQFKSMQAMARVTPQIKALQKKYENDKQRQQQELMKFYQENSINPFAACLPLVAQLPFFLGLFYLLQSDLRNEICGQSSKPCDEVAGASSAHEFLFIPDLTDKATGGVLVALIVIYIGTQLLSSYLSTTTVDKNQKILMYALPFVFTIFVINFPAGLIVYWITTNTWTMAQQYALRLRYGPMRPPRDPDAPPEPGLLDQLRGNTDPPSLQKGKGKEGAAKGSGSGPAAKPPPPPRKKKKRSGRRR